MCKLSENLKNKDKVDLQTGPRPCAKTKPLNLQKMKIWLLELLLWQDLNRVGDLFYNEL